MADPDRRLALEEEEVAVTRRGGRAFPPSESELLLFFFGSRSLCGKTAWQLKQRPAP